MSFASADLLLADLGKLRAANPRLVYAGITGYGPKGPWRDKPGQDLLVQPGVSRADRRGQRLEHVGAEGDRLELGDG